MYSSNRKLLKMYLKFLCLTLTLTILSCKPRPEAENTVTSAVSASVESPSETIAGFEGADTLAGKYPRDVGLFERYYLRSRLQKMMGKDFAGMDQFWKTESPIKTEDQILWSTGCADPECKETILILVLDIIDNNINVYRFTGGQGRSFEEKGIIGLPPGLTAEFERIRKSRQ
jgi:hypothetical protein